MQCIIPRKRRGRRQEMQCRGELLKAAMHNLAHKVGKEAEKAM